MLRRISWIFKATKSLCLANLFNDQFLCHLKIGNWYHFELKHWTELFVLVNWQTLLDKNMFRCLFRCLFCYNWQTSIDNCFSPFKRIPNISSRLKRTTKYWLKNAKNTILYFNLVIEHSFHPKMLTINK